MYITCTLRTLLDVLRKAHASVWLYLHHQELDFCSDSGQKCMIWVGADPCRGGLTRWRLLSVMWFWGSVVHVLWKCAGHTHIWNKGNLLLGHFNDFHRSGMLGYELWDYFYVLCGKLIVWKTTLYLEAVLNWQGIWEVRTTVVERWRRNSKADKFSHLSHDKLIKWLCPDSWCTAAATQWQILKVLYFLCLNHLQYREFITTNDIINQAICV